MLQQDEVSFLSLLNAVVEWEGRAARKGDHLLRMKFRISG
jgi:hypothetical protein